MLGHKCIYPYMCILHVYVWFLCETHTVAGHKKHISATVQKLQLTFWFIFSFHFLVLTSLHHRFNQLSANQMLICSHKGYTKRFANHPASLFWTGHESWWLCNPLSLCQRQRRRTRRSCFWNGLFKLARPHCDRRHGRKTTRWWLHGRWEGGKSWSVYQPLIINQCPKRLLHQPEHKTDTFLTYKEGNIESNLTHFKFVKAAL